LRGRTTYRGPPKIAHRLHCLPSDSGTDGVGILAWKRAAPIVFRSHPTSVQPAQRRPLISRARRRRGGNAMTARPPNRSAAECTRPGVHSLDKARRRSEAHLRATSSSAGIRCRTRRRPTRFALSRGPGVAADADPSRFHRRGPQPADSSLARERENLMKILTSVGVTVRRARSEASSRQAQTA
jgi:hypothetical protein